MMDVGKYCFFVIQHFVCTVCDILKTIVGDIFPKKVRTSNNLILQIVRADATASCLWQILASPHSGSNNWFCLVLFKRWGRMGILVREYQESLGCEGLCWCPSSSPHVGEPVLQQAPPRCSSTCM